MSLVVEKMDKKMLVIGLCCAAIIILAIISLYKKSPNFSLSGQLKKLVSYFKSGLVSEAPSESLNVDLEKSAHVIDLKNDDEVKELFEPTAYAKILLVHVSWCGHCRTLMPAFMQAATESFNKLSNVKWYRIDGNSAPQFAKRKDLKGFPTIYGINEKNGNISMYTGRRDLPSLLQFSKSLVTQKVKKEISFADIPAHIEEAEEKVELEEEETEEEDESSEEEE
jgi:thiol-disulfide isomerase/thioredoxin